MKPTHKLPPGEVQATEEAHANHRNDPDSRKLSSRDVAHSVADRLDAIRF